MRHTLIKSIVIVMAAAWAIYAQQPPHPGQGGPDGGPKPAPAWAGDRGTPDFEWGPGPRGRFGGPGHGPRAMMRGSYGGHRGMAARGPRLRGMPRPGIAAPRVQRSPQAGIAILGLLRTLDLSEEQREQVSRLIQENREALREARQAVQDAMKALHEAVRDEKAEEVIQEKAAAIGEAIGEEAVLKAEIAGRIKLILTEEQLEKLDMIREHQEECDCPFCPIHGERKRRPGMKGPHRTGSGFGGPGFGGPRHGGPPHGGPGPGMTPPDEL